MKKLLTTSLLTIASIGTIALGGISFADEVNNAEPTGGMVNLDNYNPRLRTKKNVGVVFGIMDLVVQNIILPTSILQKNIQLRQKMVMALEGEMFELPEFRHFLK